MGAMHNTRRRYLLSGLPDEFKALQPADWEFSLISDEPGSPLILKGNAQLGRILGAAHEIPVDRKHLEALRPLAGGRSVRTERRILKLKDQDFILDQFKGSLSGLFILETTSNHIPISLEDWLGPEIGNNGPFSERSLALAAETGPGPELGSVLQDAQRSIGALPFIMDGQGIQVVMVTTKSRSRWIFPKGKPEPSLSPEALALLEAEEEAGVEGRIIGAALDFPYWSSYRRFVISYYPMLVTRVRTRWEERKLRERKILNLRQLGPEIMDSRFIRLARKLRSSLEGLE